MWDALSPMWEGSWRSLSNVGRICFTGGNAYKHVFLRCKEIDVWLAKSIPYFIHHLGVEPPALSLSATPGEKGLPSECEGQQVKTAQCHKGVEKKKKIAWKKKKFLRPNQTMNNSRFIWNFLYTGDHFACTVYPLQRSVLYHSAEWNAPYGCMGEFPYGVESSQSMGSLTLRRCNAFS